MILVLASLASAGTVSGTVLGPDGAPLRDLAVVAYDQRLAYGGTETDEAGRFSLELPANPYRVRLLPEDGSALAESFHPGMLDLCEAQVVRVDDGETRLGQLHVRRGVELTGQLRALAGGAVEDARVVVEVIDENTSLTTRSAPTDASGRYTVRGLPPGVEVTVTAEAPGLPDQYLPGVYLEELAQVWTTPQGGQALDLGTATMQQGVSVFGTAMGPSGPARGVVSVYSPSQLVYATVEADGSWEAEGLPPGDVLAWAEADGLAATYFPDADRPDRRVVAGEGERVGPLDIHLPAEGILEGRLRGASDLTGVTLLVYNSDRTVGFGGVVEPDGRFTVRELHGGQYTVQVYAGSVGLVDDLLRDADGSERVVDVPSGGVRDLGDVHLPEGAQVKGRVLDRYTGEPIYGAYVHASPTAEGSGAVAATDHDGAFVIDGLRAGAYELWADYQYFCASDPDWTVLHYPDEVNEVFTVAVDIGEGEVFRWDPELAPDGDHDGMDDVWEERNGLDPTVDDAMVDADGDGFSNLEEFLLGTRPDVKESSDGCGCATSVHSRGLWWVLWILVGVSRARRIRDVS